MPDKENNTIIDHLSGLPRAQPAPKVWSGIEQIITTGGKIRYLSSADWRQAAAAAVLLICFNTAAVVWSQNQYNDTALTTLDESSLISDYQLYE